ncbi:MAG: hypothetical protein ACXWCU_16975 [Caldimonas sp.]
MAETRLAPAALPPRRSRSRWLAALAVVVLSGCASLLPHGRSEDVSPFATFEDARAALDRVEPYRTNTAGLKELGFDTQASTNVREIAYPQLIARVVESPYLPLAELDAGIRECISARERCRAYEFRFSRIQRERQGNFLLDFLNFRRITHTSGWRFEGLVLVRADGMVLFRNHAGEPRIESTEEQRNPLGPLQSLESTIR